MSTYYYTLNGDVIADEKVGQAPFYYLGDGGGSVAATVNSFGGIDSTFTYTPYGAVLNSQGSSAAPMFLWRGLRGYRVQARANSNRYIRMRHYDTVSGRWSTSDPLVPYQSRYAYVSGNPTSRSDPSGLLCPAGPSGVFDPAGAQLGNYGNIPPPVCQKKNLATDDPVLGPFRGETRCNYGTGLPFSLICDNTCSCECTRKHEALHRQQIASCCSIAARSNTSYPFLSVYGVNEAFNTWRGWHGAEHECRAAILTLSCDTELLLTNVNPQCQKDLTDAIRFDFQAIRHFCVDLGGNSPTIGNCPFPWNTTLLIRPKSGPLD
jgi:RHS repeat-associated protein